MTIAFDIARVSPSNIEGGAEDSSYSIRSFFSLETILTVKAKPPPEEVAGEKNAPLPPDSKS